MTQKKKSYILIGSMVTDISKVIREIKLICKLQTIERKVPLCVFLSLKVQPTPMEKKKEEASESDKED